MKLQVIVFEARGLAAKDSDGSSDPYVKLQLGRTKSSTSVIHKCLNPVWNEEFSFRVDDLQSEIVVTVWDEDSFTDDFLGQVKLPVSKVLHADKLTLPATWYTLQKRSSKSKSSISGEILLSFALYGRTRPQFEDSDVDSGGSLPGSPRLSSGSSEKREKTRSRLGEKFSKLFAKKKKGARIHPNTFSDQSAEEFESSDENDAVTIPFFQEDGSLTLGSGESPPPPLPGGVLLDQTYATSLRRLNAILFKPGSAFFQELVALQKLTDVVEGEWGKVGNEQPKRTLTYMKPTALMRPVKATEEQVYIKADDMGFVVLSSVSTPDVPSGSCFKTEVQYCLTASGQDTCHLCISWRVNFLQKTMMKSVIESSARKGLQDNFQQYTAVLAKYCKPVTEDESMSRQEQDQLDEVQPKSDWELFREYMCNPMVVVSLFLFLLMLLHIYLAKPSQKGGLEFWELDFPDSLSELITSAVLTFQMGKIINIASRFLRARVCVVGDHGIKAKGEGWLLTVTLVEGENLPMERGMTCLDPYVIFTCNGKTRTSSVKLQTTNPTWGEVFEFDATEDPPSTLDVEVFNYDGPFLEAMSLGSAEINFLRDKDLWDIWVNLEGKLAQASGARLHLRIFLTNTKEAENTMVDYVKRVEKEVGTKIINRIWKNSSFQKLFSLPAEEFLVNDFACAIKRKIPLQGRMFLSPRMLGFYSNIFGHKTKFSILWEDIEEVESLPLSLANVGPSIILFTRKGRAHDANAGAKGMDAKGRLKFQFQSFVRPGPAYRTLMVLWKNRALTPEQRIELVQVEAESKGFEADGQIDGNGDFLGVEDAPLGEVFSTTMPFTTASMMAIYEGENLEVKIMEKLGCINYTVSPWETAGKAHQRQVNYKLNRHLCQFGSVVSATQQRETSEDQKKLAIDEILTLHDVPFGDNFQIHVKIDMQTVSVKPPSSICKVYVGIAWQKQTPMQSKITANVNEHFTRHLKEKLQLTIKEIMAYKDHQSYVLI